MLKATKIKADMDEVICESPQTFYLGVSRWVTLFKCGHQSVEQSTALVR
jgi:hypothetical protein